MKLTSISHIETTNSIIYLVDEKTQWEALSFTEKEVQYIDNQFNNKAKEVFFNYLDKVIFVIPLDNKATVTKRAENCRLVGAKVVKLINKHKLSSIAIANESQQPEAALQIAEGIALANYQFLKYKTNTESGVNSLATVCLLEEDATVEEVGELQNLIEAVYLSRNLTNEPLSYLTAPQLGKDIKELGKTTKLKIKVFGKAKIESLGMGGVLAVNRGSEDPPSFSIMEWKPKNAVNEKPIVLVGKGVVYDTGGVSLKPSSGGFMEIMKSDMGGASAVIGTMYAVAKNELPLYVVGLVPSTDNRPGKNAYVPGDVITMHSGATVEVINTDAEGRMLLADALSYAKSYDPELVIDLATLTGTALMVVGPLGMLVMGNADEAIKSSLKASGEEAYERLVELPLWDEYKEMLKSPIADIKHLGGRYAGAITAGKFLEHFTDYPWLHIDMAPTGWNFKTQGYRIQGGSGIGVRLLYNFLKKRTK